MLWNEQQIRLQHSGVREWRQGDDRIPSWFNEIWVVLDDGKIIKSPVPPAKKVVNLLWPSVWCGELEPVYDVVVEGLVIKVVILESQKNAARQGEVNLKFDC